MSEIKKYLDSAGLAYLWGKIKDQDAVNAAAVENLETIIGDENGGLVQKVNSIETAVNAIPEYSIVKLETPSAEASTSYQLTMGGVNVGAVIDIPKDMVVSSGAVVTNPDGQPEGTYIELTLANSDSDNNKLYINVADLVDVYTASDTYITVADYKIGLNYDGLKTDLETYFNGIYAKSSDLEGIEAGAQVNVLESIKFNGSTLTIADDKSVDLEELFATSKEDTDTNKGVTLGLFNSIVDTKLNISDVDALNEAEIDSACK